MKVLIAIIAIAPMVGAAQVRCTMPNGVVIEQKLATHCPHGAVAGQTLGGQALPIARPPEPVHFDGTTHTQAVREDEFGPQWPLVVPQVELRCRVDQAGRSLITARNGDAIYAVNGSARSAARARKWSADISPIWRMNRQIPGTRIPISPLIERGQRLCGQ